MRQFKKIVIFSIRFSYSSGFSEISHRQSRSSAVFMGSHTRFIRVSYRNEINLSDSESPMGATARIYIGAILGQVRFGRFGMKQRIALGGASSSVFRKPFEFIAG